MKRPGWPSIVTQLALAVCAAQGLLGEHHALQQSRQLITEGRPQEALPLLVALRDQLAGAGAPAACLAVALNELGAVYHTLGRHKEAEKAYAGAIRLIDTADLPASVLSRLLDNLASLYMDTGRAYSQVERLRKRALALRIDEVGPDGPGVPTLLSHLATVCSAQRRFEEADTLLRRALAILKNAPGDHDREVAGVLHNMAAQYGQQRRYSQAESCASEAVAVLEGTVGQNHPELIVPLLNLARIRLGAGQADAAEPALYRALAIAESRLGPEHPMVAEVLTTIAEVYRKTRRKAEASSAARRALAIRALHPIALREQHSVHISELTLGQER